MMDTDGGAPVSPEAAKAEAVVEQVAHATLAEKRSLAIDHKLVMSEVQLLLAEKRTAFALLRTGVSVSLVPLSIWTVLVATSRLWNPFEVMWLLAPILVLATALFLLGVALVLHALGHVRHVDRVMQGLRQKDTLLEDLLYKERDRLRGLGRITRLDRIPRLRRRLV
jgi:hypothetical protein